MTDAADRRVVEAQLGRPPRDPWRVAVRCASDHPQVIASPLVLSDGTPFPSLYWLTCPYLVEAVGALESSGESARWAERVAADPCLARELLEADAAYRREREREGSGTDVCADAGIAGQTDPLAIKCLHGRVAAALAGIPDPIGWATLVQTGVGCHEARCARLATDAVSGGPVRDDRHDDATDGRVD